MSDDDLALRNNDWYLKGNDLLVRTKTISVIIDRHSLILPVVMSMVSVPPLLARSESMFMAAWTLGGQNFGTTLRLLDEQLKPSSFFFQTVGVRFRALRTK